MVFQENYVKVATTVLNSLQNLRSCVLGLMQIRPIQSGLKEEKRSPSVTEQRQQKRGKHDGHDDNERSRVRQYAFNAACSNSAQRMQRTASKKCC